MVEEIDFCCWVLVRSREQAGGRGVCAGECHRASLDSQQTGPTSAIDRVGGAGGVYSPTGSLGCAKVFREFEL